MSCLFCRLLSLPPWSKFEFTFEQEAAARKDLMELHEKLLGEGKPIAFQCLCIVARV